MKLFCITHPSIVGKLKLVANEEALVAILWEEDPPSRVKLSDMTEAPKHPLLLEAGKQLEEYFQNKRKNFSVKLEMQGTEFQKQVWQELLAIPYGETRSYTDIAKNLKRPKAVRAVGSAIGKNPISILVPCHRVIGSNGKLTGFAGGLETKALLLNLEASNQT